MFKPVRILALLFISLLTTSLLYWIDSDPPSDTIFQMAINVIIVFGVVLIVYYGVFRLLKR